MFYKGLYDEGSVAAKVFFKVQKVFIKYKIALVQGLLGTGAENIILPRPTPKKQLQGVIQKSKTSFWYDSTTELFP